MPTVRITRKIKREIVENAKRVADSQRENLPEADDNSGKNIVNFLIDKYNLPTKGHKDIVKEIRTIHFTDLSHMIESGDSEKEYDLDIQVTPPIKAMLPHCLATATDRIYLHFDTIDPDFSETIIDDLKM